MKFTKLSLLGAVSAVALTFAAGTNLALADGHKVKPIKMRWASDHSGPPHPAAIAEVFFAEQVEKRIPGSKVQVYWAHSIAKLHAAGGDRVNVGCGHVAALIADIAVAQVVGHDDHEVRLTCGLCAEAKEQGGQ